MKATPVAQQEWMRPAGQRRGLSRRRRSVAKNSRERAHFVYVTTANAAALFIKGYPVHQLVYISTARHGLSQADIDDILRTSRHNNRRDNITGLLVHDDKRFLQALEGYGPLIEAAFGRIKRDDRHRATVMLSYREVHERQFGTWDMACQRVQPTNQERTFAEMVDALVAQVSDPNIQAQFRSFARIQRRAA